MINVSNEFRKLMEERTDFTQYAEMTLADGTELILTKEDFSIDNNSVVDSAETSGIPLGVAVCRHIQIEIDNRDEKYSEIDFFCAKIRLYLTFELSETTERIEYGTFTVLDPETYGETVIITALDDMYKANREYSTNLIFPATIKSMLVDACNTLDIPLGSTSFLNDDFVVSEKPTGFTFRQLFGYIAMIAAGNIRIDTTGRLRVLTYDFSLVDDIQSRIDGGDYLKWSNPSWVDGGNFTDYSSGDDVDGGTFEGLGAYHILKDFTDTLNIDTDDVVITGISTTTEDENGNIQDLIYGIEGYVLKIENPLIVGQEENVLQLIGSVMVGGKMRRFSGDLIANPTCEFMDIVAVTDRKGNVYASILTDVNFNFFGFTVLSNSAAPAMRNSSQTYSAAVDTLVSAKKMVEKERTAREKAVEQLAKDLKESSGLFMTEEKQPDGSVIYYMHDKPTLNESMIVWKLTALAFGISTDGGKTYPYGFTVNGEVITRLLYAEGIDADYINTGSIKIADANGNIMFLADYDTKQVIIKSNTFDLEANNLKISSDGYVETKASNGSSVALENGGLRFYQNGERNGSIYVQDKTLHITGADLDFGESTIYSDINLRGLRVNIAGGFSINGANGLSNTISVAQNSILPTNVVTGLQTASMQVVTGITTLLGQITPVYGTITYVTGGTTASINTVSGTPKTLTFTNGVLTNSI